MNIFTELPKASEADKEHLFAVSDLMVALAKQSRFEGILALEEWLELDYDIDDENDDGRIRYPEGEKSPLTETEGWLFALLLSMVLDGTDPSGVCDIARYALLSCEEKDGARLALMLGAEGIAALQRGENPRIVLHRLKAMMGRQLALGYSEHKNSVEEAAKAQVEAFFAKPEGCLPFPPKDWDASAVTVSVSEFCFEDITRLCDREVQKFLREIDTKDLALALTVSSDKLWRKILSNISHRYAEHLKDEVRSLKDASIADIQEAQKKAVLAVKRLIDSGDITLDS